MASSRMSRRLQQQDPDKYEFDQRTFEEWLVPSPRRTRGKNKKRRTFERDLTQTNVFTCYDVNASKCGKAWRPTVVACHECEMYHQFRVAVLGTKKDKPRNELNRDMRCCKRYFRLASSPDSPQRPSCEESVSPVQVAEVEEQGSTQLAEQESGNILPKSPPSTRVPISTASELHRAFNPTAESLVRPTRLELDALKAKNVSLQIEMVAFQQKVDDNQQKFNEKEQQLREKQLQLEKLTEKFSELTAETKKLRADIENLTNPGKPLETAFIVFLRRRDLAKGVSRRHTNTLVGEAVKQLLSNNGSVSKSIMESNILKIRHEQANPLKDEVAVARAVDLIGNASLGHRGLNVLRTVTDEDGKSWLASDHKVKDVMKNVEQIVQKNYAPMTPVGNGLDGIVFDFAKAVHYLFKIHGLDKLARETAGVQLAFTLDAADLTKNISHVTAGIKIVDPRAIDPVTGEPLGTGDALKFQSRHLCFPLKILLAKDSKNLYDEHFKDFFDFIKSLQKENNVLGYKPLDISSPQDASSFWKCLKVGGACKVKEYFCHCCACKSRDCATPNVSHKRCQACKDKGKESCYHWPVGDVDTLLRVREELDTIVNDPVHKNYFCDGISLNTVLDEGAVDRHTNISNVDFDYQAENVTRQDQVNFKNNYINHDLKELGLPLAGDLAAKVQRLRDALGIIALRSLLEQIENGCLEYDKKGAMIVIRQAIPCILHCENRSSEKIIKLLLIKGWEERDGDTKAQQAMVTAFEEVVNTEVLGEPGRKTKWQVITGKDKDFRKVIGEQTMPNTNARKFVNNFEKLSKVCIQDEDKRAQWDEAVSLYRPLIQKARQKEDFTPDEIEEFSAMCDSFYQKWISLFGSEGVTNYFHMIGSGHLTYFLKNWGNLYRFSQQGWESLNALIKSYYFRRTQRGGFAGVRGEKSSAVEPIGRFFQRRMFWLSNEVLLKSKE